jgi:hypothetical protein
MLFHVGEGLVKALHEWLSLVLVGLVGLHVYRNKAAFFAYVRNRTINAPMAISALAAAAFIIPAAHGGGSPGNPMRQILGKVEAARLAELGPALGSDAVVMMKTLSKRGFKVSSPDERIAEIAARPGRKPIEALMDARRPVTP